MIKLTDQQKFVLAMVPGASIAFLMGAPLWVELVLFALQFKFVIYTFENY
jgi:hypothetical protein